MGIRGCAARGWHVLGDALVPADSNSKSSAWKFTIRWTLSRQKHFSQKHLPLFKK
jgi:hypothetical protein